MCYHFLQSKRLSAKLPHTQQGGFGLVELMVSISIMAVVSAAVLFRQDGFNSAVLLRSQAYEVAADIRNVQYSAVSPSNESDPNSFRNILGVHFDKNERTYKIFRDQDGDYYYDSGEEFGQQGLLDPRFEVRAIKLVGSSNQSSLSIIFERPNFDAKFFTAANTENNTATAVEIEIASTATGDVRTVTVSRVGQISVQ